MSTHHVRLVVALGALGLILVSSCERATEPMVASSKTPTAVQGDVISSYASRAGSVLTVQPNGGDDTPNLQAAFDQARKGDTVQLIEGIYHTGQVVVNDLRPS